MDGTIPVFYKQRKYNIPIVIWLLDKHPIYAPMVYVQPTATMVIRQGRHVDASGKVYLPYLSEWKPKKSDLSNLVNVLCTGKNNYRRLIFIDWKVGMGFPIGTETILKIVFRLNNGTIN